MSEDLSLPPFAEEALIRLDERDAQRAAQALRLVAEEPIGTRALLRLDRALQDSAAFERLSIAVAAPFRTGLLGACLRLRLGGEGWLPVIRTLSLQALVAEEGPAGAPPPDVLVVFPPAGGGDPEAEAELAARAAETGAGLVLIGRGGPEDELAGALAPFALPPREALLDARLSSFGEDMLSEAAAAAIAWRVAARMRAARGAGRKLVLCDLDGLLWRGTLGEDGPRGVRFPGDAHDALQRYLKHEAEERGVLLAIVSKNDFDLVDSALEAQAGQPLPRGRWQAIRAGWGEKRQAAEEVMETLRVAPFHTVFLDDNPAERLAMRERYPDMVVPETAAQPEPLLAYLERAEWFAARVRTGEDRLRAASISAALKADEAARSGAGLETLRMRAEVLWGEEVPLPRTIQMFARVTQFTATGETLAESQIAALRSAVPPRLTAIRLEDRFADHGVVALAATRRAGDSLHIDALLMSCRVLGRGVETVLLQALAWQARREGARWLIGRIAETARNTPVRDVYARHGFTAAGAKEWRRAADDEAWPDTAIEIAERGEEEAG